MLHITSGLVAVYVLYCFSLFVFQRQIIYPGAQIKAQEDVNPPHKDIERIWLDTSSGKVEAWYIPPHKGSKKPSPVVIFAHGNGELIDYCAGEFEEFTRLGMGALIVEYPGYGRSEGSPSEKSIIETFTKAYDTVIERPEIDPSKVVLFGRSLGGGAVCALAAQRPCAALIVQSTFISLKSFSIRFLAPQFIVRDSFDNLSVMKSFTGPVLVIHGKHDDIVPYSHGVELYESAQNGQMISYECRHNDCPPNWDIFWNDIKTFLVKAQIIS